MPRLIDQPFREIAPLITALSQAGLDEELAAVLRRDPDSAKEAIKLLRSRFLDYSCLYKSYPLINYLFRQPEVQLDRIRRINAAPNRHWNFTEEDFARLGPAPAWPDEKKYPFGSVVLVPYFDTPEETYRELWMVGAHEGSDQGHNFYLNYGSQVGKYMQYWPGNERGRGLVWERIDLCPADSSDSIERVHGQLLPSAGVLAAGGHFPHWIRAMRKAPSVFRKKALWAIMPGFYICHSRDMGCIPSLMASFHHADVPSLSYGLESPSHIDIRCAIPRFITD